MLLPTAHLGQQRQDGDASMATNDRHIHILHIQAFCLSDKGVGTDNIQGCHADNPLGVIHAQLLQGLSSNWYGGVHGVGDDAQHCLYTWVAQRESSQATMQQLMVDIVKGAC